MILFGALASDLGGDELAVQGLIVVVLVHVQVHLVGRWELRRVQLVIQMCIIVVVQLVLLCTTVDVVGSGRHSILTMMIVLVILSLWMIVSLVGVLKRTRKVIISKSC